MVVDKLHPIDWKTSVDVESVEDYILQQFFLRPSEFLGRPILVEVKGQDPEPLLTNLSRERWFIPQPYPLSEVKTAEGTKLVMGPKPDDIIVNQGEHYRLVKRNADIVIHIDRPFYMIGLSGKTDRSIELLTPIRQVIFKKTLIREDTGEPYWDIKPEGVVLENALWENQEFGTVWRGFYDMIKRWMRREGMSSASRRELKNFRGQILSDESFCIVTDDLPHQKEWTQAFSMFPIGTVTHDTPSPTPAVVISKGWLGLRDMLFNLAISKGISERDAHIISWFAVPPEANMTRRDLKESMVSLDTLPETIKNEVLGIRQDSFDAVIRRKLTYRQADIPTSDLGRCGEEFLMSRILLSLKPQLGGGAGQCDISDRDDCDPLVAGWALNVKLSLESNINRSFHTAPEHLVTSGRAWLCVIAPRDLRVLLSPITGEHTPLSDNPTAKNYGQCVTLEEVPEAIRQLIMGD